MLGDFSVETEEPCMQSFLELYGLKNLISERTWYKNPEKPSSTDLILTNSSSSFQNSCAIKPKLIYYGDSSMFSNDKFREELLTKLSMENISNTSNSLKNFLQICISVLDKLAPQRKKYDRDNNTPFMNKPFAREHMKRTHLRNQFLKTRSEVNRISFIKQRNYCVSLLRKTKKQYYANLNEKDVADNKKFWKTVKPLLSDKLK